MAHETPVPEHRVSRLWHLGRLPPPEVLFLHRKLGGMYLLSQRLRSCVDLGALLGRYAGAQAVERLDGPAPQATTPAVPRAASARS